MSQFSSEQTRQILEYAKTQIQQKQFIEARRALLPIATHPTAAKWLAKLDEIAPQPKMMTLHPIHPYQAAFRSGDGNNSIGFLTGGLIGFLVVAGFKLPKNWETYGKSAWHLPTSIFSIILPFVLLIGIMFLGVMIDFESSLFSNLFAVLMCSGGTLLISAPLGLYYLQHHAFKAWEKHRNDEKLLNHRYPWVIAIILIIFPMILTVGPFVYAINYEAPAAPPKTYETAYFNMNAPTDWYVIRMTTENSACDSGYECLLGLQTRELGGGAFLRFWAVKDVSRQFTLASFRDAVIDGAPDDYSGFELVETRQVSISGQPTEVIEFTFNFQETTRYSMTMFFYYDASTIIEVNIEAESQAIFEALRPTFPDIFRSIQLKQ